MVIDVNLQELKPLKNFGDGCPGCGTMLSLKLLLQSIDNFVLVNATNSATPFIKMGIPIMHAGLNAIATARGVARSLDKKQGTKVVVFAGDGSTAINMASMLNVHDNILYVCANDYSCTSMNYKIERNFSPYIARTASYTATACISYPQDYITKLKKAYSMTGFRFIEVLSPCPVSWGYEPSNTIEVGRIAVETGIWPLYEIESGVVNLTKRPNRLEPVENFNHVQKNFAIRPENLQNVQDSVNKNWKTLTEGRLF